MDTLLYEEIMKMESRMSSEKDIRAQERDRLVQAFTRNRPSAVSKGWASVAAGLGWLVERGSHAVRSALTGPSEPSEQCC